MAIKGKNMVDIKQGNRAAILTLLHEQGGMSRKQIAGLLQLTPAAITMIVGELIEDGLVCETGVLEGNGGAGRKEIIVEIDGKRFFAIGISFGIENAVISVTNMQGELLSSETFLFDYDSGAEYIITKACSFAEKTIKQREQSGLKCVGVGISVRGSVDEPNGICVNSHGAWREQNVPVKELVQNVLKGCRIQLRQNVRALAETFIFDCHEEAIESMLLVKNDTGIGSSLVIGHKIYGGFHSNASEMGHITIDDCGKPCRCGSVGCLETVASCTAMESDAAEIYDPETTPALFQLTGGKLSNLTFERMALAIQQGDAEVRKIVDRAVYHFARVLRIHIGILDVQKIVLHGTVFHQPYFYEQLKREINFDGRYPKLDSFLVVTGDVSVLNIKCSPVMAIKAFFSSGGLQNGE